MRVEEAMVVFKEIDLLRVGAGDGCFNLIELLLSGESRGASV